ncbi:MAG: hypothetical protein CL927_15545 [Deltaproteobacteria bacterium]|nr:hypothetical protein [Deltaproteobacteria bacterium]HCH66975.1 hypothetical protein [Deltaproteobacteria bacterium]
MSQERWDVKLQFLSGPLRFQDLPPARGPVIRLGANPGPGGVRLTGYRGIDDRQAVITVYDGAHVSIAPVGVNQVRVATHQNVEWAELLPIQKRADLAPGTVVHLGPPNRGCTFMYIEARRLGDWQQKQIVTLDEQAQLLDAGAGKIDTTAGRPWWFYPAMLTIALPTTVVVLAGALGGLQPDPDPLGPEAEGEISYERFTFTEMRSANLEGLNEQGLAQAFEAWVMVPNVQASGDESLLDPQTWDPTFYQWTTAAVAWHARAWRFWGRLESREKEYRTVVTMLQEAGLPEVFAGIPYQESGYTSDAQSVVCALGWWQFMPEVALRAGMKVSSCNMRGTKTKWTPKGKIPVKGVLRNAPYVKRSPNNVSCLITSCDIDQRTDLELATAGAIQLLSEAWNDGELRASGAAVQATILSHNAGYDDARYSSNPNERRPTNILPAYRRHLKRAGLKRDPHFYGKNLTCLGDEVHDIMQTNNRCEGVLANQTQHYAYSIVAQHILAACYYGKNYPREGVWKTYTEIVAGDGYCTTLQIPTAAEVQKNTGNRGGGR